MARKLCPCALQLLLLSGLALTGCGSPAAPARADPINVHIFCQTTPDGQGVTCDPQERLTLFSEFIKNAIHRPNSTFTIFQSGPDRQRSRPFFTACVPDRWGSHVMKAKADFIQRAREGAGGSRTGLTEPAGCRPPGATPGSTKLVVFPDVSPLKQDVWQALSTASGHVQRHSSIVCDRSDSTQMASCTPPVLLALYDKWITESLLLPGATLSVEMVGPLHDALHAIFDVSVPNVPVAERVAYVLGARGELARLFTGSQDKYGSTIAAAVSAAVRRVREHRGAYSLTILSDMQEITQGQGGFHFERAIPPPADFVAWLKKNGLAPDLKGISVLICGVPTGHFGTNSASYATRLQNLWTHYFQSFGAAGVKFYSDCQAALAA
jgi:hypothetical protein